VSKRYSGRIDHFIWVVRPENIGRYVAEAEDLFGVSFEHMHGPSLAGTSRDCYVSWEAGLEFMAPLGRDDPTSAFFLQYLEEHGEGPWGFVFGVDSLSQSVARAQAAGYEVGEIVQGQDTDARTAMMRRWTCKVSDVREVHVGSFLGTQIMFGDIDYLEDA
jgi:hypothetical protein